MGYPQHSHPRDADATPSPAVHDAAARNNAAAGDGLPAAVARHSYRGDSSDEAEE